MAFTTYDSIIAALTTAGQGEAIDFSKANLGTTVQGVSYDLWLASGAPTLGTFGTALTGRIMTDASVGAMGPFTNPGGGRLKHALSFGAGSTISLGTLMLYDRLAEYPFTGTITGVQTFTTQPALTRDAAGGSAGVGVSMLLETFSATARAATTVTIGYTNEAGTAGRSIAHTTVAGTAIAGGITNPLANPFKLPLQDADLGVRTIQTVNATASLLAANMCLTLFRPIAMIPILASNSYSERDLVLQMANLPRLYDDSCLGMLLLANTTSAPAFGRVVMAEG